MEGFLSPQVDAINSAAMLPLELDSADDDAAIDDVQLTTEHAADQIHRAHEHQLPKLRPHVVLLSTALREMPELLEKGLLALHFESIASTVDGGAGATVDDAIDGRDDHRDPVESEEACQRPAGRSRWST